MQHDHENYGRYREPERLRPRGLGPQDENTWSALSHASVLLWPLTFLLPVAPLIVWVLYKDRSPRVGFHALQSLWYQVAWLVIFVVAGTVGTVAGIILTVLTFGLALIPLSFVALVLVLWPFVHQLYAAYKALQGSDYRYPLIADRIDGGHGTSLE